MNSVYIYTRVYFYFLPFLYIVYFNTTVIVYGEIELNWL